MNNGVLKILGSFMVCLTCSSAMSAESYSPNPFTLPPAANNSNNSNNSNNHINNRRSNNESSNRNNRNFNNGKNEVDQVNSVTQVLTEKEIRSSKILESINSKMANAKNIPIENSRYVGVINGKRIYQNIETNEYVKVEMENN